MLGITALIARFYFICTLNLTKKGVMNPNRSVSSELSVKDFKSTGQTVDFVDNASINFHAMKHLQITQAPVAKIADAFPKGLRK